MKITYLNLSESVTELIDNINNICLTCLTTREEIINSIDKILEDLQMLDITEMMYRELWNAVKTLKESKITYNKQITSCIEYGEYLLNTCAVLTLHFL